MACMERLTPEERSARMQALLIDASDYGQLQPVGPFHVQLTRPAAKINHGGHFLVTLVTFGLWLPIWILVAALMQKPEQLHMLSVDEYGMIWVDNELRPLGLGRHKARPAELRD
jgi:hypothetical protein